MKASSFKYFIAEGFKSFWINGLMSLASVVIITACLLLFGIYILFSMNINHLATQVTDNYEIRVFIDEKTSDARTKAIGDDIARIDNVKEAVFVSKDEAWKEFTAGLNGEDQVFAGLENDNPLRDGYHITMKDMNLADDTAASIEGIDGVAYVNNDSGTIKQVISITGGMRTASLWLMLLFAAVSLLIIANTIKLTVFARRRDINIMKFIGATDWFISWPFIIEGIIIGIIGAVITILVMSQAYGYLYGAVSGFLTGQIEILPLGVVMGQLVGFVGGLGVIIGAVGSAISVRKYLDV